MSDVIYNFRAVEKKWTKFFAQYSISNEELIQNQDKKAYILEMLPYPSGSFHMGHVRNYTIGDVVARYQKMLGFTIIHPMGWDSFGMPAENAAMQSGGHPKTWTEANIEDMKKQLKPLGYMYDWQREISTCSVEYYTQEQKIFLDFYKKGLVYRKKSYVNWDPIEQTVLANEQVIDGKGWRSGALVEKKMLEQWSLRITDYAEELLQGLKELEGHWPDNVLKMQENWIGKSEGAIINFEVINSDEKIAVFTTRPDTLFGASFLAISPDHEFSQRIASKNEEFAEFIDECKKIATTEESIEKAEKKGKFTGLYVKHPVVEDLQLPIYIANFVLMDYGTGAVFGCPAHDERDFEFAQKYNLPIKRVIDSVEDLPFTGDGKLINSEYLDGMSVEQAKIYMINRLQELNIGTKKISYRLRDWLISRQRYWGCPIPIVHCENCGAVPAELPVYLPDDVSFDSKGNPLANHPTWKFVKCPKCGNNALRETDTLDTFFESSWYFLRYLCPNFNEPIDKKVAEVAMPVDLCIGGIEHAVLHLLYARFFVLALRDLGYIDCKVPFANLLTQGMVCHKSYKNTEGEWVYPDEIEKLPNGKLIDKNGIEVFECAFEKMSKSKKNVISHQKIIDSHGVDAVRLFIVSDTPPEKDFSWNTDALDGSWRFLNRVWKVFNKVLQKVKENKEGADTLIKTSHVYLKKIKESYDDIALNKSVAFAREFFNEIERNLEMESASSLKFAFECFIKAIYPITPHIAHEMFEKLTNAADPLQNALWPEINEDLATATKVTIAVQVNGRLRGTFNIEKDTEDSVLEQTAKNILKDSINLENIEKIIVVKNRIVNIVVK
ncbi:MAG: leucine--tRNA ligase [Holosporales bacterium]|jgi:leucyl-tRNA synthetase|nr:leucine--tRNA ligase [Holosporales bacterium]